MRSSPDFTTPQVSSLEARLETTGRTHLVCSWRRSWPDASTGRSQSTYFKTTVANTVLRLTAQHL